MNTFSETFDTFMYLGIGMQDYERSFFWTISFSLQSVTCWLFVELSMLEGFSIAPYLCTVQLTPMHTVLWNNTALSLVFKG